MNNELGPEPLESDFTFQKFQSQILKKPNGKIKMILMDQKIIAGIGNIYSDEMLWLSYIHPESQPKNIPNKNLKNLYLAMKKVLSKGIKFGGDSMSDYRNIDGERGSFQHHQNVYQKKNEKCGKKNCQGVIERKIVGARSTHFCNKHQFLF
jgi:formamidopyrimidine-DNA glycosylase